jgi:hypothetical protein
VPIDSRELFEEEFIWMSILDLLFGKSNAERWKRPRVFWDFWVITLTLSVILLLFRLGHPLSTSRIPDEVRLRTTHRVFDCFLYSGESLMLLIRLRTLSAVVSTFILGYSNWTFSGRHPRPLTYSPYDSEISAFSNQLRPHHFDVQTAGSRSWSREHAARNALMEGLTLQRPDPHDLVSVSDIDEILNPSIVSYFRAHPPYCPMRIRSRFFYYSLRWEVQDMCKVNVVMLYGQIQRPLHSYRRGPWPSPKGFHAIHCSYCFGSISQIIHKLETFSHTEFSKGKWVDPNYILGNVLCGRSLFNPTKHVYLLRNRTSYELSLPPDADWLWWRLPFNDLDKVNINIDKVRKWATCNPNIEVVNGGIQAFE